VATFTLVSLCAALVVVASAGFFRGRFYAIFSSVLLGIHTFTSTSMAPWFEGPILPAFAYLQAAVYLHFLSLVWARMRPLPYRVLVSLPASYFVAGSFLALPWAIATRLGFHPWVPWLPYAVAFLGLVQSIGTRKDEIDVQITRDVVPQLGRWKPGLERTERPLRIVQITDTHLGPFMSETRLRRICERAVEEKPDLVMLTGDFLTMESHGHPDELAEALSPLRALPGRVFACRGNHDHEDPATVLAGLDSAGVRLLVDESVTIETDAGRVQIVGLDYSFRDRKRRIEEACTASPREEGALRVVLLHDPGAFKHLPDGEADLVLSGHTHGGQLGLLSLGLKWTVVSALTAIPDHGLWALGKNRLYVHRGTGHYGFPLRLGVPSEESVLRVHRVLASGPHETPLGQDGGGHGRGERNRSGDEPPARREGVQPGLGRRQ
jgi:uncharacterized protein